MQGRGSNPLAPTSRPSLQARTLPNGTVTNRPPSTGRRYPGRILRILEVTSPRPKVTFYFADGEQSDVAVAEIRWFAREWLLLRAEQFDASECGVLVHGLESTAQWRGEEGAWRGPTKGVPWRGGSHDLLVTHPPSPKTPWAYR